MATFKLLVLSIACLFVDAISQSPPVTRNTIFGDEKLEGQIFETIDTTILNEITPLENQIAPEEYRLPNTTKPIHYNVLWSIDIEALNFTGTVEIDLVPNQAGVNQIVIQADDLEINSYRLERISNDTNGVDVNIANINVTQSQNDILDFLYFTLESETLQFPLANDTVYRLTIDFSANMRDDMYGIYKSWFRNNYTEVDNTSWMATTQFQATSARRAFPCYDEPSFKATFNIKIRRPVTHKSWSCTRIQETRNSTEINIPDYEEDVYHTTPIMSTYLIAIIVAEYESLNDAQSNADGVLKFEVISRPNAQEDAVYAFDVGQLLLGNMSEHTGIDFYEVNENLKMTQAAIPDFSAGAMENWGLLTYREAYLLYNERDTNKYFKQLIAYILSHEIAHMWFGNLVTCEWWDVLWLNEGFARYYQYFLTYWVEDMGLATRFINEQVHTSLLVDSANTHPLSHSGVGSPSQVSSMFSTISYNKGAAIIRMTEHLLGFEVHREGLRHYLKKKYKDVALPIDLFESLQEVAEQNGNAIEAYGSDFSVIDYYKTWTEQPGHPVLNVHVDHTTGQMSILQRRFDINNGFGTGTANWIIPITFATANNPDFHDTKPTHIINQTVTIIDRGSTGQQWVVFNKQQTGFYRVNYDEETWNLIILALRSNNTQIHEYNRAQIVNDVFQFARSGVMTYSRAFNILSYLRNETQYAPLVAAITGFTWIRNRLIHTPYLTQLEELIRNWTETAINQLGYVPEENEEFMVSYLRYQLAPFLCLNGNTQCLDAARTQFRAFVDNETEVAVDNRNWVYCNGLRQGTAEDFEHLLDRFKLHNVYTERIVLLQTLGCTTDEDSLIKYLRLIFEGNETKLVRPQDLSTAFNSALTGNENNTQIVFNFIKTNLPLVSKAYASLSTPLTAIAARLRSQSEVDEFRAWVNEEELDDTVVANAERSANDALASLDWINSVDTDLSNYFENGDDNIIVTPPTDPPPTTASTVTPSDLIEPTTPELPDSAVTSFISTFAIIFAAVYNFIL